VPITIDRPTRRRRDPFDRIAAVALKLPATRRMGQALQRRPSLRRWLWFAAIYAVSVIVFGAVAFFLNAIVPK
jgi:hypothetical protein